MIGMWASPADAEFSAEDVIIGKRLAEEEQLVRELREEYLKNKDYWDKQSEKDTDQSTKPRTFTEKEQADFSIAMKKYKRENPTPVQNSPSSSSSDFGGGMVLFLVLFFGGIVYIIGKSIYDSLPQK